MYSVKARTTNLTSIVHIESEQSLELECEYEISQRTLEIGALRNGFVGV